MRRIFALCFLYGINTAAAQTAAVHIYPDTTYQTISNFGASDAWSCQFVGQWPLAKKNAMADWLFSMDTTATGSPVGIGLSLWRVNIGAGSSEQTDIKDEWHRTGNWQDQEGQLWFMKAASQRHVKQFLAFLNSPPVSLTINGKGFATKGVCNISPDKYDAMSAYIADAITGIHKKTGILFDYISPVNEPQWDWSDNKQEGCPYNNEQISGVTKSLSSTLLKKKITTKIVIGEAGKVDYLYSKSDKPDKGEQFTAFFDPHAPYYIGGLSNVKKILSAHSYFTTSPFLKAVQIRTDLAKAAGDITFWQSEYCILGDNDGEINGNKRDYGMDAALYLARVIHTDLAVANAAAWQYWLAISPYDYKDGLIYIDKNKTDGEYKDSKMLWVLGNYSRFIRPGAKRIKATINNNKLLVSAYKNTDRTIDIVIINNEKEAVKVSLNSAFRAYVTSDAGNLQPTGISNVIDIPARSVVTLTNR